MNRFTIADQVDELAYDFSPYASSGTIPEPSSAQIDNFKRSLAELIEENAAVAGDGSVPFLQQLHAYLATDTTEVNEKVLLAVAAICSEHPSIDDLKALPFRPLQAFLGWVVGIFLTPEASRLATTV